MRNVSSQEKNGSSKTDKKKPSLCKKQVHNMLNTIAHEDDGCDLFRACLVFLCEICRAEECI